MTHKISTFATFLIGCGSFNKHKSLYQCFNDHTIRILFVFN
jgi:hypothetical protein